MVFELDVNGWLPQQLIDLFDVAVEAGFPER